MIVVCIETNGHDFLTLNKKNIARYSIYGQFYRIENDWDHNILLERKLFISVKLFRKKRIKNIMKQI